MKRPVHWTPKGNRSYSNLKQLYIYVPLIVLFIRTNLRSKKINKHIFLINEKKEKIKIENPQRIEWKIVLRSSQKTGNTIFLFNK